MATQAPLFTSGTPSGPVPDDGLCTPLDLLLADALRGRGGVLELEGSGSCPPFAAPDGVLVLRVTAAESEAELPFAVLADVLRPVLHHVRSLPEPQGEALRAALALSPPSGQDRLALCAATLGLLVAASPIVVVIDDAQWIDPASSEPLQFAFRRLAGTQVAAVLSRRTNARADASASAQNGLLDAAVAARVAGRPERALHLLDDALASTDDPLVRADVQHERGLISMWRAAPANASRQLLGEAARVEKLDPAKAAWMTADAACASFMAGELDAGLAAAEKASGLASNEGGTVEVLATGLLGIAKLLRGRSHDASPLLKRFAPLLDDARFLERASAAVWPAALALVWLEEYGQARDAFTALVHYARTHGAPTMLPHALVGLSELEFRTGDWVAARAAATEAVQLADETGQPVAHAFALLALARVAAPQGREQDCTAHVFEAVRLAPSGAGAVLAYAGTHLGALEFALGRSEATISHLEQVTERAAGHGLQDPGVVQWAPDLIEAYVRCGRTDDAETALAEFERRAQTTGRAWALATAARCRGLLAPAAKFEPAFLEARERHARSDTPFDRARTELCFGARLRRARRRSDARAPLREALAIFQRLGAEPWAARARSELLATGETVRSGEAARTDELTAQEAAVARLVADGATNREAAAALYVSVKTIETHLGRVYRKLQVRSRTELARLLA
jgi:DNA-binding CsgD family transcriptional regulator